MNERGGRSRRSGAGRSRGRRRSPGARPHRAHRRVDDGEPLVRPRARIPDVVGAAAGARRLARGHVQRLPRPQRQVSAVRRPRVRRARTPRHAHDEAPGPAARRLVRRQPDQGRHGRLRADVHGRAWRSARSPPRRRHGLPPRTPPAGLRPSEREVLHLRPVVQLRRRRDVPEPALLARRPSRGASRASVGRPSCTT